MKNIAFITLIILSISAFSYGQRPGGGGPPGGGGRPGMGGPPRGDGPMRPGSDRRPDGDRGQGGWQKAVDTNNDQKIDLTELQTAADATFADLDKNHDGILTADEIRPARRPDEGRPPMPGAPNGRPGEQMAPRPDQGPKGLPPFFFMKAAKDGSLTKADFDAAVKATFDEMDKNHDGVLSKEESRGPKGGHKGPGEGPGDGPNGPPPPPHAQFIGAELRFGDKFVKGQPFSADTVIEDNRRLYDGTAVTKEIRGAIYRDAAGRTRREQPLDSVGGFNVVGDNAKPQILVFINDFDAKTQYFLDMNNKVARRNQIGDGRGPKPEKDGPEDAKTESLGTKTIEGVTCEGTRTTFEIPAGQIGNAKPIQVVSEKWFSPELQVVVLSRHLDPLAGEHVFRLVNIKRLEPAAGLFSIPDGFKIEENRRPRPEE